MGCVGATGPIQSAMSPTFPLCCMSLQMNRVLSVVVLSSLIVSVKASADELPFPSRFEWGHIKTTPSTVELQVTSVPKNGHIRVPRFNNPYKRIYLKADETRAALKFHPEVSEWVISVPASTRTPATVVIETVGAPSLMIQPAVTRAAKDGSFLLPAHDAVVHGDLLRYEPQPHKNTVGYWANEDDWCEWRLNVSRPGVYNVLILQGCGKGHGGSRVRISLGDSELAFVVEDTGHFQNFRERAVGQLRLGEGKGQSLKVEALHKAKGAIMDVRQIRLVPVRS